MTDASNSAAEREKILAGYLDMYKSLRGETAKYHEALWKIIFATVAAAAAVASLLTVASPTAGIVGLLGGSRQAIYWTSAFIFVIGIAGAFLAYVYAFLHDATLQAGNVYRNAWVGEHSKEKTGRKLIKRYDDVRKRYGFSEGERKLYEGFRDRAKHLAFGLMRKFYFVGPSVLILLAAVVLFLLNVCGVVVPSKADSLCI